MKTVEVQVEYDDQPEEINERWVKALRSLGVWVTDDLEPPDGRPIQRYQISLEE